MDYVNEAARILRTLSGVRDDVADRADHAARYAATEAKDVSRVVQRFVAELTDVLADRMSKARDEAGRGFSIASESTRGNALAAQRFVADEVRERPVQAVLALAAAGLVIGWLFRK